MDNKEIDRIENPKGIPARNSGLEDTIPLELQVPVGFSSVLAERGCDGSRGLQPTVRRNKQHRRGATAESKPQRFAAFKRRSATHACFVEDRGLKPTATVRWSLRDLRALGQFYSIL